MRASNDSPFRSALQRLCMLLGILLVLMLGATLYVQDLMVQGGYTRIRDIPDLSLKLPEIDLSEHLSFLSDDKIGGPGSDIINVLLVGHDQAEEDQRPRSDSMILCTYHKKTKKLTMTSFLRDLYVPIPGHEDNRINAAYAEGGIDLLEKTLETNFGLHIDGGIEADFSQFADIVDLLGGVEIQLRQDEADYINEATDSNLTEGTQKLNGQQALIYSRIRSLDGDGDFSRTNRQRKVLSSIMDICRDAGIPSLLKLIDDVLPMISTDMSTGQLLSLALELLPNLSEMEVSSQHVPAQGTYTNETIHGMAVLVADTEAVQEMLKQTLLP